MTDIEKLLVDLINIPSVSGDEKQIGDFLFDVLTTEGFAVKRQMVEGDRFNLVAHKGRPQTYVVVHMDVVPGHVPVTVTDKKIYGRGAIDNKGNIAGAIIAGRSLDHIGLIFTVGEEVGCIGAQKAPKYKKKNVIVMEPTRLRVATSQRGIVAFDITARGTSMHSSLPFRNTQSAVYLLTTFLQTLYKKKWTAFNVMITHGGDADNIVADRATALVTVRPKTDREYAAVTTFVTKHRTKKISMKMLSAIAPCRSTVIKGGDAVPYFSEMAFFDNSLLFGVGDINYAHKPNEHVARKDLNILPDKLSALIRRIEK